MILIFNENSNVILKSFWAQIYEIFVTLNSSNPLRSSRHRSGWSFLCFDSIFPLLSSLQFILRKTVKFITTGLSCWLRPLPTPPDGWLLEMVLILIHAKLISVGHGLRASNGNQNTPSALADPMDSVEMPVGNCRSRQLTWFTLICHPGVTIAVFVQAKTPPPTG